MQRVPSPFVRRRAGETRRMRLAADLRQREIDALVPAVSAVRLAFRHANLAQGIADVDPASPHPEADDANPGRVWLREGASIALTMVE